MTSSADEGRAALEKARAELAKEHLALRALLDTLRVRVATPNQAHSVLSELHKTLAKHFAHETYPGGFYDGIRAARRELEDELAALVDEHFQLLATTQALRERAERGDAAGDGFSSEIRVLLERLSAHEQREREVVDRALAP